MKKVYLILLLLTTITVLSAQNSLTEGAFENGRWSVAGELGFNLWDGDFKPSVSQMASGIITSPLLGVSVEYNLSPLLSLGFTMGGMLMNQEDADESISLGATYVSPYLSTDLFGIISGRKNKRWSLWAGAGIGLFNPIRPVYTTTRAFNPADPVTNGVTIPPAIMLLPLTMTLERSLTQTLSLGLVAKFNVLNSDHVDGMYRGKSNDHFETVSMSLRYKILPVCKQHFRDQTFVYLNPPMRLARDNGNDIARMTNELELLENKLRAVESRVHQVEGDLEEAKPALGLLEEAKNAGNLQVTQSMRTGSQALQSVFFDFDKVDLDRQAQITVFQVADVLRSNPSMKVEIRGYADYVGTNEYNKALTQLRAERVKRELVTLHGINADRITTNGMGKVPEPPASTTFNRRCDFFVVE